MESAKIPLKKVLKHLIYSLHQGEALTIKINLSTKNDRLVNWRMETFLLERNVYKTPVQLRQRLNNFTCLNKSDMKYANITI